ncbi:TonB-dependent receptor [Pseudoalteromonas sp. SCSIO 43201]|uniref:Iron complex outermembrane recepter protein n=1 Tax=Pseudoalteromonas peptidolytica F12-50-A1 TaxID=1315280 RepID=A0A8I0MTX4_9GAMM|nr:MULTISPECIES: TonB-dependent receptor [Pseudoalteromonas]MBE0345666.1 iron complex outermembrane recepter protein [Pseudoalteromonas peptidolytica F12-50-A1]MDW7547755.1 TonB-dependent receptor [Pseudoalteromonas peptidolytica]USD27625.1 TonB-dependent receptor [Pseudoalteromonas sp. SCSIO 43201]GEK09561.1 TonB-dependent receptor [Pseudoalteromonas peptidolytica]
MLNNKVSKAVRLGLAFGAASTAVFSATAAAEEASVESVERIQVTGSRIKRTDLETAMPVSSFSMEDIKASGVPTLEQFVQQLPVISGGSYGSNVNNGGNGTVSMNLRGLGSDRTLVLLNGRRFSGDISTIPMAAIARVDVLRDGASTIYGSDAIAGVVNFITAKNYTGTELEFRYQETSEGDGESDSISFVTGIEGDKGSLIISAGYDKREAIYGKDRDFSSCPRQEEDGKIVCGGSTTSSPGTFKLKGNTTDRFVMDENGNPRPFVTSDSYNYSSTSILYQPRETYNLFAAGRYELAETDFSSIEFFSESMFTHRSNTTNLAPVGTFWGMTVPESHPNNNTGDEVYVNRRLTESGNRRTDFDVYEYLITTGFEGEFSNGWYWDFSYGFNHRRVNEFIDGRVHQERMNMLVNPALCNADNSSDDSKACAAAVAGTPDGIWNPFVDGSLTQDMLDWVIVPLTDTKISEDTQLQINITGDSGDFELPAGVISWAAGYEHLTTSYEAIVDGASGLGAIYGTAPGGSVGKYNTKAYYVEANIPLLADVAFAERLDLTVAARRTKVNLIEDAETTKKIALEWRPNSELMVRANYSEGFRTPSITDLFRPFTQSADSYSDPCKNYGSNNDLSATFKANCAADGLPGNWGQPNAQSGSWWGGNPDLGPETSESKTFGFVWSPDFIEGFSATVDYYDIEISNVISSLTLETIAQTCYESENFSSPVCNLIKGPEAYGTKGISPRRNLDGNLVGVDLSTQNLGFFNSKGIDFDFNYAMEALGGNLRFKLAGTHLLEQTSLEAEGLEVKDLDGYYGADIANGGRGAFNDWRANLRVSYDRDNWGLAHTMQYQSAVDDVAPAKNQLSSSVGSVIYNDLSGYYHATDTLTLSLGVNNLFDKQPPYVSQGDNGLLIRVHRLTGREYYAKATFKF